MHLAAYYATARTYGVSRDERKMLALDEFGKMGDWDSGQALFTDLAVDSRKWNIDVSISSQDPAHVLRIPIENHISTMFLGRVENREIASQALRLMGVEQNAGYEEIVAGLSPQVAGPNGAQRRGKREFIVKDVMGNVEKVVIDIPADLLANQDTTPDVFRKASTAEPVNGHDLDLDGLVPA
jgi:hypothetical protein